MIIVDTSAIVAIFLREEDAADYAAAIGIDNRPVLSVSSLIEASIVMRRRKLMTAVESESWLDKFIITGQITIEPVTLEQANLARAAHIRFGKGTGHPAQLNFGDCFAYALAKDRNAPLLFKGDDFSKTDIASALTSRRH